MLGYSYDKSPNLPKGHPFVGHDDVIQMMHWSSTTMAHQTIKAWTFLYWSGMNFYYKDNDYYYITVWPVRTPQDFDGDGIPDHVDPDDDNDGMSDVWEDEHDLDPMNPADAGMDSDGDSFSNLEEFLADTNPGDETSIPTGDCGDETVVITGVDYPSDDDTNCSGSIYIIVGPDVTVAPGAEVTFISPMVMLRPNFRVLPGGVIRVANEYIPSP